MRISDWSSDVCSSDLARRRRSGRAPCRRTALSCPGKDRILALLWDHFGNWRSPEFKCELFDQRSADTVDGTDSCLKHRRAEIGPSGTDQPSPDPPSQLGGGLLRECGDRKSVV